MGDPGTWVPWSFTEEFGCWRRLSCRHLAGLIIWNDVLCVIWYPCYAMMWFYAMGYIRDERKSRYVVWLAVMYCDLLWYSILRRAMMWLARHLTSHLTKLFSPHIISVQIWKTFITDIVKQIHHMTTLCLFSRSALRTSNSNLSSSLLPSSTFLTSPLVNSTPLYSIAHCEHHMGHGEDGFFLGSHPG